MQLAVHPDAAFHPGARLLGLKRLEPHYESRNDIARIGRKNRHGQTKCLEDWAAELGINPESLRGRLARGWPPEFAIAGKNFMAHRRAQIQAEVAEASNGGCRRYHSAG